MQPIHPINEQNIRSLIGKPVLLYLNNGLDVYGIVSRIDKNKLILNDNTPAKLNSTTKTAKPPLSKKVKKKTALPSSPLQANPSEQLSSFGLPLFGGPSTAPPPRPTGPVDIQIDYIAAMFSE
jgi:hypothetical protein